MKMSLTPTGRWLLNLPPSVMTHQYTALIAYKRNKREEKWRDEKRGKETKREEKKRKLNKRKTIKDAVTGKRKKWRKKIKIGGMRGWKRVDER